MMNGIEDDFQVALPSATGQSKFDIDPDQIQEEVISYDPSESSTRQVRMDFYLPGGSPEISFIVIENKHIHTFVFTALSGITVLVFLLFYYYRKRFI